MGSQSGLVSFFVVTFGVSRAADSRIGGRDGVLERLGRCVVADEAGDDGGGEHSEALVREIDRFDRLLAPQLLDLEGVAVETANESRTAASAAADSSIRVWWRRTRRS